MTSPKLGSPVSSSLEFRLSMNRSDASAAQISSQIVPKTARIRYCALRRNRSTNDVSVAQLPSEQDQRTLLCMSTKQEEE